MDNHSQAHSRMPPSPRYKNKIKISHTQKKLQANITDKHRHRNPKQKASQLKPATH